MPKVLDIHLVMDNYGTHKTDAIKRWIAARPRLRAPLLFASQGVAPEREHPRLHQVAIKPGFPRRAAATHGELRVDFSQTLS